MKRMATLAVFVGMMLLSSCSWMKRRNLAASTLAKTEEAQSEVVQPSTEQQEAAMKLLTEEEARHEPLPESESVVEEETREHDFAPRERKEEKLLPDPDPAQQHGLRSPALPKLLPMDINGKLTPGL